MLCCFVFVQVRCHVIEQFIVHSDVSASWQGMVVNGFVNVSITSIEKRFELSSRDSGLVASFYDIGYVLCSIPVGFFGGRGSKPRWLGFGALIMALGSFLLALPHFATDLYK